MFDLEVLARFHSDVGAEPVTDEDIQDPVVPPAFVEVCKLVSKRVFGEFESDAKNLCQNESNPEFSCHVISTYPTEPVIPENEGLPKPPECMGNALRTMRRWPWTGK